MSSVTARTHVLIGFANPYLVCDTCYEKVPYWHDPSRCNCNGNYFNSPCKHEAGVSSICYSWSPVDGCRCINKETHDRD